MATRKSGVFNDDGIWQTSFFFPLPHKKLNATRIRKNRDQCNLRMIFCELWKIQWQTCTHHQGVGPTFDGLLDLALIGTQRLHDVDRDPPLTIGIGLGCFDLAIKRLKIGRINLFSGIVLFV